MTIFTNSFKTCIENIIDQDHISFYMDSILQKIIYPFALAEESIFAQMKDLTGFWEEILILFY